MRLFLTTLLPILPSILRWRAALEAPTSLTVEQLTAPLSAIQDTPYAPYSGEPRKIGFETRVPYREAI